MGRMSILDVVAQYDGYPLASCIVTPVRYLREGKIMSVVKKPLSAFKGDFYHISAILSEEDQDLLFRVRAFMEAEVAPIINHYWIREEFPHQIIPGLAALNI